MNKTMAIILATVAILGYYTGYRLATKRSIVPQSPQIVRVYKANTKTDNPAITVKTQPIQIKKINNRGDKKILPVKQEIIDKRTGEVTVATTEIPQVIKNDLSKLKVIGYLATGGGKVGIEYELFNLGDFGLNAGLGSGGILYTVSYSVRPGVDLQVGGQTSYEDQTSSMIIGVGVRI